MLRFLLLIDEVVFESENIGIANWIWHLNPIFGETLSCSRWNAYAIGQSSVHRAGIIRQTLESMRCASYTYTSEIYELPGVLEEIPTLKAACREAKCQKFGVRLLPGGHRQSTDIIKRIDNVSGPRIYCQPTMSVHSSDSALYKMYTYPERRPRQRDVLH